MPTLKRRRVAGNTAGRAGSDAVPKRPPLARAMNMDHARRGANQLTCAGCGEIITSHRMICPARKDSQDDDDQEESVEYAPCDYTSSTVDTPSLQDVAKMHLISKNGLGVALVRSAGNEGEIVLLLGLRLTKTGQQDIREIIHY
ncbi:hypothetical protein THAOC_15533 [Thalassiosira oceanica]|uniref:Uncharacterized protein n=1 Tax=Thalassiosira oceanica TaxID=159749 RepID=K0SCH8_THAOC|nr:hypothetical protein THAOC_15533 [Thalassiosira oceanica]|eukprot:EJK63788.1 hypothetical protein THAOC_15533 [Thalassiosira oceanica]